MLPPLSRNAPCPCGSGKRYKDCHGALAGPAPGPHTPDELWHEAQFALANGRPAEARPLLERAVELAPQRAELWRERARIEWALGDARAAATCRAAIARAPADVSAWNLLAEMTRESDPAVAEEAWRHVLLLDPDNAEASFHLGNLQRERGEAQAAIAHYERALRSAARHPGVLNNLGLALEAVGDVARAEACYRDVLATQPRHPDALANLANLQYQQARYRDAVATYERAFAVRRDFPANVWIQRACAEAELRAFAAAEASLREAARLCSDDVKTHIDIGSACLMQSRFADADAAFSRALELDPRNPYALTMSLHSRQQCCLWHGLDERFVALQEVLDADAPRETGHAVPFPLLAMPLPPLTLLRAAQRWAKELAPPVSVPPPVVARTPGERLRVGFVSSDFREHPTAFLLMDCWERIDRMRIEAFAYSLVPLDKGPIGQRIAAAFEHVVDVSEEATARLAQRIRSDHIGILFDLNGYTSYARSELFPLRPAPVQINWLGYLGTLGADWYDYIITDGCATPEALQPFFSERFLYLPDCYCPSDTRREVARPAPTRKQSGLPAKGLVFCCFNTPYKILPGVFDVWMHLLTQVPTSVLWLSPGSDTAIAHLREEAAARGVEPQRLIFAPRVTYAQHLARHAHADLFLDTSPYNGGTTVNDALFMGVPVITCAGSTMASRIAASQLQTVELSELITTNLGDYEMAALRLAQHPDQLAELRSRLMANRQTQPLFDMARFARNLENALERVWLDHAARMSSS